MSAVIHVRVEGDKLLLAKLKQMGVNVDALLEAAVTAGAVIVEAAARVNAPGPEIEHETAVKTKRMVAVAVGPTKRRWYYRFMETGAGAHQITGNPWLVFDGDMGRVRVRSVQHPGMAARPFLRPAIDERQREAETAMGRVWKAAVEAVI